MRRRRHRDRDRVDVVEERRDRGIAAHTKFPGDLLRSRRPLLVEAGERHSLHRAQEAHVMKPETPGTDDPDSERLQNPTPRWLSLKN
jgi:hypothetical protein